MLSGQVKSSILQKKDNPMVKKSMISLLGSVVFSLCITHINAADSVTALPDLASLEDKVKSEKISIVKFGAPWCGACNSSKRPFKKLAKELEDSYDFYTFNIDHAPSVTTKYAFGWIPTVIIFKNGVPKKRMIGEYSTTTVKEKLNEVITEEAAQAETKTIDKELEKVLQDVPEVEPTPNR